MFLDLDRGSNLAVYGRARELSDFFKSILICVPKDERRSCEFGMTWGWEINYIIFIFGWTIPLIFPCLCTCMHALQILINRNVITAHASGPCSCMEEERIHHGWLRASWVSAAGLKPLTVPGTCLNGRCGNHTAHAPASLERGSQDRMYAEPEHPLFHLSLSPSSQRLQAEKWTMFRECMLGTPLCLVFVAYL